MTTTSKSACQLPTECIFHNTLDFFATNVCLLPKDREIIIFPIIAVDQKSIVVVDLLYTAKLRSSAHSLTNSILSSFSLSALLKSSARFRKF
jgi:hypothetical protein